MIGTKTHQALDYIVGIVLILAPFLFAFATVASATWVAILCGVVLIVYSLLTAYSANLDRPIPFRTHLTADLILGIFLAISPWLFGFAAFAGNVWLPHLIVGLAFVLISLVSVRVPLGRTSMAGALGGETRADDRFENQ